MLCDARSHQTLRDCAFAHAMQTGFVWGGRLENIEKERASGSWAIGSEVFSTTTTAQHHIN